MMSKLRLTLIGTCAAALAASTVGSNEPNSQPNPYKTITGWYQLPDGRKMGSTSAVDIDRDGKSIWVVERCGTNSCLDRTTGQMSPLAPILHFDPSGKLLTSFGAGMLIFPHGIYVDKQDNIWVTDGQDNAPIPARGGGAGRGRGAAPTGPIGPRAGSTKGHQVFEFSKEGKLLMTLGKPGGGADPDYFYAPNDVIVSPKGDIFVSEGHGAGNNRVFKFDKAGKLIKVIGKLGTGPGEFDQPHALAFDSKGRLFIGDRNNNRVVIYDQDLNYISELKQFSRPSGIFIDKKDVLYVADSESGSVSRNHDGWKRGIRIGKISDGIVTAFIPDPDEKATGTSAAEGVAVDAKGVIYGAEVGPHDVKKYVKK